MGEFMVDYDGEGVCSYRPEWVELVAYLFSFLAEALMGGGQV